MVDEHNNENDFKCPLTDCYYVPNDSEMKWIIEPEKYLQKVIFKIKSRNVVFSNCYYL